MFRLPFNSALLLAPLVYAIHHAEEHLVFSFRDWRLRYFPDNNALTTEAVLVVLMAISMTYILLHSTLRTKVSAWIVLVFLMATQVHNALFHLGGTLIFSDFSPGLITGLLLYIPVNCLIMHLALQEGYINKRAAISIFVAGGFLFWGFEYLGPIVLLVTTILTWAWALVDARIEFLRKEG